MSALGTAPFGMVEFGAGEASSTLTPVVGWGGRTTLFVEIDLSQAVDDIGVAITGATLWDAATWDGSAEGYAWGEGTTWTDVTPWCRSVQTRRGFSRQTGTFNAGSCTVTLDNRDGRFSPDNTLSPYRVGTSTSIGIWRPMRVRAQYESPNSAIQSWSMFTGFVRSWDEDFPVYAADAVVTVQAVDAFAQLAAFDNYAQTPAGGGELSGARISRILDAVGYTGDRFIDAGEVTLQSTDLEGTALTLLRDTATSEGGKGNAAAVWVGAEGAIRYDGASALLEKARSIQTQVTFADDGDATAIKFRNVDGNYDGDLVSNMAAYKRVDGTVQTVVDAASRSLYGDRQLEESSLLCETDAQALLLAQRDVGLLATPERRIESLSFVPHGQGSEAGNHLAWDALSRDLIQLRAMASVRVTPPAGDQINRTVHLSAIGHTISNTLWTVGVEFSSATVYAGLVDSRWDTAEWDSENWSW